MRVNASRSTSQQPSSTNAFLCFSSHNSDDDLVIALPTGLYPDVGSVSEYCGKTVLATNTETGVRFVLCSFDPLSLS